MEFIFLPAYDRLNWLRLHIVTAGNGRGRSSLTVTRVEVG